MRSLVIQAGGESRRMGQDKALLLFRGQTLIERLYQRLSRVADEILVTTNRPESYAFLGLPLIPDLLPGTGALGGLYTALDAAHGEAVAVVACDMPFASAAIFAAEFALLDEDFVDAVLPQTAHGGEPFHAVYRREPCLSYIRDALGAGERRADAWHAQARVCFMTASELLPLDPHGLAFLNVNTPRELHDAERFEAGWEQ